MVCLAPRRTLQSPWHGTTPPLHRWREANRPESVRKVLLAPEDSADNCLQRSVAVHQFIVTCHQAAALLAAGDRASRDVAPAVERAGAGWRGGRSGGGPTTIGGRPCPPATARTPAPRGSGSASARRRAACPAPPRGDGPSSKSRPGCDRALAVRLPPPQPPACREGAVPDPRELPAAQPSRQRGPSAVPLRHVPPGRPGPNPPQDAVEDPAVGRRRTTASFQSGSNGDSRAHWSFLKLLRLVYIILLHQTRVRIHALASMELRSLGSAAARSQAKRRRSRDKFALIAAPGTLVTDNVGAPASRLGCRKWRFKCSVRVPRREARPQRWGSRGRAFESLQPDQGPFPPRDGPVIGP
jgi:hypothetical protein